MTFTIRVFAAIVVVLGSVSCGGAAGPDASTSRSPVTVVDSATTSPPTAATTASLGQDQSAPTLGEPTPRDREIPSGDGVAIEAVGTIVSDSRGLVICPFEQSGPCPGLPLTGATELTADDQVRIGGRYDGTALEVAWTEPWIPEKFGPLDNPCTGEANLAQPSPDVLEAADSLIIDLDDRVANTWISDGQLVVALTGTDDEAAATLRAVDGVCVETGYQYSRNELVDLVQGELRQFLVDAGAPGLFAQMDAAPVARLTIEGDGIDQALTTDLVDRYGDLVEFNTFITVLDASLADLPDQTPAVPGDIVIPTAGTRSDAAMAAAWEGAVLELDDDLECLYVDNGDDQRTVVVWPFGYTAAGTPKTVYNAAGEPVATVGEPTNLGGGFVSADDVDPAQRCGADSAFFTSGPTAFGLQQR